jgi:hypothetical protein
MTLINSRALKRDARPPVSKNVAAKDIVRRNHLGQNVLVVPKGQPIPDDLKDVTDEERGVKKKAERYENKAASGRPTPKSSSK